ncbi:MAG: TatD family deoxyribonuclease [Spirochaetaceae bacterium]|nr:MAG: TatD family deoxyribonuclease [Spirochaetaceae bacterium]
MQTQSTPISEQISFPQGTTDSHFHLLEIERHGIDPALLLKALSDHGFGFGLEIAIDEQNFARRLELAEPYPGLYLTAGLHPSVSGSPQLDLGAIITELRKQLQHPKVRAAGEMGIDLFRNYASLEKQRELFVAQLRLASEQRLPVVIHNRDADLEILKVLKENPPSAGGIMHCFSSGSHFAHACVELGMYISFAGNLSFRKAESLRGMVSQLPRERILVETDAPYLTPQPFRGKTNHPGRIGITLTILAELLQLSVEAAAELTTQNLHRLLQVE